jgi:hypothetical protein
VKHALCLEPWQLLLARRRVHFAGCTTSPEEAWLKQVARNLTAADDGFLAGKRYTLNGSGRKVSAAFRAILNDAGVEPMLLPPLAKIVRLSRPYGRPGPSLINLSAR